MPSLGSPEFVHGKDMVNQEDAVGLNTSLESLGRELCQRGVGGSWAANYAWGVDSLKLKQNKPQKK